MKLNGRLPAGIAAAACIFAMMTACAGDGSQVTTPEVLPDQEVIEEPAPEPISRVDPDNACQELIEAPGFVEAAARLLDVTPQSVPAIHCFVEQDAPTDMQTGWAVVWEIDGSGGTTSRTLIVGLERITDPSVFAATEAGYREDATITPVGDGNAYFREFTTELSSDLVARQADAWEFRSPVWLVSVTAQYFNRALPQGTRESILELLALLT